LVTDITHCHNTQSKTMSSTFSSLFFLFNDTPTTQIYTLSLHDALPISTSSWRNCDAPWNGCRASGSRFSSGRPRLNGWALGVMRSEEHTSELQSRFDLVCRLLLEKKKKKRVVTDIVITNESAGIFRHS